MPKNPPSTLSISADLDQIDLPRERMLQFGPQNLKDYELLAILLRTGYKNMNILDMSRHILEQYNLERFLSLTLDELMQIKGISRSKACTVLAAIEFSRRILKFPQTVMPTVQTTNDILGQVHDILDEKKEYLIGLYLNARSQLICREILSIGSLDSVPIYPREVFRPAVANLAAYVILVHNHPSGSCEISQADLDMTYQVYLCSKIMGIELLDHLVVTTQATASIMDKMLELNML